MRFGAPRHHAARSRRVCCGARAAKKIVAPLALIARPVTLNDAATTRLTDVMVVPE